MSSPLIIIPSLGQSVLHLTDSNGERFKKAWPFELDQESLMNELKGSLMKMMLFRVDGGFSDRIASIVADICEPFALNEEGERLHNISVSKLNVSYADFNEEQKAFAEKMIPAKKIAAKIGANNVFYFAYDFLDAPQKSAKELSSFIDSVILKTGSEKVSLAVCGTGGVVAKAYVSAFENCSCIEKIVFVSAALDGMTLAADLLENKLQLDNPMELLSSLGGKAASLSSVAGMLPADVINNVITKSFAVAKKTVVQNSSFIWSLVPNARFESMLAKSSLTPELSQKVKNENDCSKAFRSWLDKCNANGTQIHFLCGCGKELPAVASEKQDSDGITDVFSSSLSGAFPENTVFCESKSVKDILASDGFLSLV